jgi:hypothetical protein
LLEPTEQEQIYYGSIARLVTYVRNVKKAIEKVYQNRALDKQAQYLKASELRQACVERIGKIKLNNSTMYRLLCMIEEKECVDISSLMFASLFGYPNESFFEFVAKSKTPIAKLIEYENGKIDLYGFRYSEALA